MAREYVDLPTLTGLDMCELIAEVYQPQKDGRPMTPEEIWNSSPTGELWHVFSLGTDAYAHKHGLRIEINTESGPNFGDIRLYREVE